MTLVTEKQKKRAFLPPRWFVRVAWSVHRGIYRISGGRLGLSRPKENTWGTLRLTTTGRRSGQPRSVMVGYFEDGANFVTMAMNGWAAAEPAWWLNLQAQPEALIELPEGTRAVRGRAAEGEERSRLWERWREIDTNLDSYAARRPTETAVVVLEPAEDERRTARPLVGGRSFGPSPTAGRRVPLEAEQPRRLVDRYP